MLAANQLARTCYFLKQGLTRLVRRRPITVENNANVGPLKLDLANMHRIANDEQGTSVRRDLVSRVAWGVPSDGVRTNAWDDLITWCNGLPLASGLVGLG